MKERMITIVLKKQQIVNDVSVECNLIGRTLQKNEDMAEIASEIMSPDDDESKPVIARSMTEAFGEVKKVCQRYLVYGRDTDDNRLEGIDETFRYKESVTSSTAGTNASFKLPKNEKVTIKVESASFVSVSVGSEVLNSSIKSGSIDYTSTTDNAVLTIKSDQPYVVELSYSYGDFGSYELSLSMPPSFNIGVTETLKSNAHRMIVDYTMQALLRNQFPEKSQVYAQSFDQDAERLRSTLRARLRWGRRAPDWA